MLIIAPPGKSADRALEVARSVRTVGARAVVVTASSEAALAAEADVLFPVAPDHQMTVTDAGKKLDPVATEIPFDVPNHSLSFFGRYMIRSEILHVSFAAVAAERHEIAAKRDVLWPERDTHAGCLQRRPPGVINRWIITHNAHISDIAPRRKPHGDYVRDAATPGGPRAGGTCPLNR